MTADFFPASFFVGYRGFSIRILLFGKMVVDLPTPVFHSPSYTCTAAQCTHPKSTFASLKYKQILGNIKFLKATLANNDLAEPEIWHFNLSNQV